MHYRDVTIASDFRAALQRAIADIPPPEHNPAANHLPEIMRDEPRGEALRAIAARLLEVIGQIQRYRELEGGADTLLRDRGIVTRERPLRPGSVFAGGAMPPKRPHRSYRALMHAIREAGGDWIYTPTSEITGVQPTVKIRSLKQAAKMAGLITEIVLTADTASIRMLGEVATRA